MRKDILSVENITMQFGGVVAVNNLSLHIPEGQIVALIGPNGAGKTTAFNCITGVYEPTNGLDEAGRERFFSLLDTLFPQAVKLIITHDMSVAAMCGSALVLCGGRMLEYGPSETLLTQPRHPYTLATAYLAMI